MKWRLVLRVLRLSRDAVVKPDAVTVAVSRCLCHNALMFPSPSWGVNANWYQHCRLHLPGLHLRMTLHRKQEIFCLHYVTTPYETFLVNARCHLNTFQGGLESFILHGYMRYLQRLQEMNVQQWMGPQECKTENTPRADILHYVSRETETQYHCSGLQEKALTIS